ncbi:MAG: uroporphyrinogen-III C-methyltransferase [Inquilinaceae bacterium]
MTTTVAPHPSPWVQPAFESGTVWLVGAGPGDPGLLTLLAVQAIREADIIVHDALIGDEILAGARPDAVLEYAGKRAGRASSRQDDISRRLIALARQGYRVLRLKGGDPFVFGRGGEEVEALAQAGVPFRVVPGVTAGIGGLAYAGIPATRRGVTGVVSFVTGHGRDGGLPADIDWPSLAAASPVLVFYMGLRTLPRIAERLIAAGRSPMTPAAIVSNATMDTQSVITTNLARAAREAARLSARSPAIIAIGEVVHLHDTVALWQQIGPDNRAVASTRALAAAARALAVAG